MSAVGDRHMSDVFYSDMINLFFFKKIYEICKRSADWVMHSYNYGSRVYGGYLAGPAVQSTKGEGASVVLSVYSTGCQSCSWGPEHAGFQSI